MRVIKIRWSDGDYTVTSINGTMAQIADYYFRHLFHLGEDEHPVCAVSIIWLN